MNAPDCAIDGGATVAAAVASTSSFVWPRREIVILGLYFMVIVSFSLLLPQLPRP